MPFKVFSDFLMSVPGVIGHSCSSYSNTHYLKPITRLNTKANDSYFQEPVHETMSGDLLTLQVRRWRLSSMMFQYDYKFQFHLYFKY